MDECGKKVVMQMHIIETEDGVWTQQQENGHEMKQLVITI